MSIQHTAATQGGGTFALTDATRHATPRATEHATQGGGMFGRA